MVLVTSADGIRIYIRTALHHLSERLHCHLLCTLKAALCQEGTDDNLQGAPPGQVVVLCRTGGCFTTAPTLKNHINSR